MVKLEKRSDEFYVGFRFVRTDFHCVAFDRLGFFQSLPLVCIDLPDKKKIPAIIVPTSKAD